MVNETLGIKRFSAQFELNFQQKTKDFAGFELWSSEEKVITLTTWSPPLPEKLLSFELFVLFLKY